MRWPILYMGLALVLLLTACPGSGSSSSSNSDGPPASVSACVPGAVYTALPMAIADLGNSGITPLGNLNPPDHTFPSDHLYFYIKNSTGGTSADNVPVYAPATITITDISSGTSASTGKTDYSMTFYPCSQVQGYFYHMASLSSTLLAAFNAASPSCSTYNPGSGDTTHCTATVTVTAAAGEQIGTAGGPTTASFALDFGTYDNRTTSLHYANAARTISNSGGFDGFHVACPIDYFTNDLKSQLSAQLDRLAEATPLCGSADQDLADTAQGKWFTTSATSPPTTESGNVALVHGTHDPTVGAFSVSNAATGTGVFTFTPTHVGNTNRDFSEVTADGKIYCYDTLSEPGIIFLIQMPTTSSTTLKIEKQSGADCTGGESFTSGAVTLVR